MNKHLLDIPLETPKSDLPHYAKRWTPEGFRERMEQRKAQAVGCSASLCDVLSTSNRSE